MKFAKLNNFSSIEFLISNNFIDPINIYDINKHMLKGPSGSRKILSFASLIVWHKPEKVKI